MLWSRCQGPKGGGGKNIVQGGTGASGQGVECGQRSGEAICHAVACVGGDPGIKKSVF